MGLVPKVYRGSEGRLQSVIAEIPRQGREAVTETSP
jgi:hypothetical protein